MKNNLSYKLLFFTIIFLQLLIVSCKEGMGDAHNSKTSQTNDSIAYWLDEKNSSSEKNYKYNLGKAFNYALEEQNDSLKSKYFSKISYYNSSITGMPKRWTRSTPLRRNPGKPR